MRNVRGRARRCGTSCVISGLLAEGLESKPGRGFADWSSSRGLPVDPSEGVIGVVVGGGFARRAVSSSLGDHGVVLLVSHVVNDLNSAGGPAFSDSSNPREIEAQVSRMWTRSVQLGEKNMREWNEQMVLPSGVSVSRSCSFMRHEVLGGDELRCVPQ